MVRREGHIWNGDPVDCPACEGKGVAYTILVIPYPAAHNSLVIRTAEGIAWPCVVAAKERPCATCRPFQYSLSGPVSEE